MSEINGGMVCKNCGAPVTSEICPYCGSSTGLNTEQADMEYPVLDCKEANIGFWSVLFPAIFACGFGFAGVVVPLSMLFNSEFFTGDRPPMVFFLPFTAVGLVSLYLTIMPLYRYMVLRIKGKKIMGKVYGYVDDNMLYNGRPAQVVKLLVQTPKGPRFIMYQLHSTNHPYGINTQIPLVVYKDYFMIGKQKKETIDW